MKNVNEAGDNRLKCKVCEGRISKGEKYFRDTFTGWRQSHIVNICEKCFVQFVYELDTKRVEEIKKKLILEKLDDN